MDKLLTKSFNCYMAFLTRLNKGNTSQDYCILYDSILCLKHNITEKKYLEYFTNNLNC